jgi:membrane-bound serine protease (ClpP class)
VLARYLVFQVPGWVIVGAGLVAAVHWWQLAEAIAWLLFGLFVSKDLLMFPFVRKAYEPSSGSPADALVGRSAVATDDLAPAGYVRIGSELWASELRDGGQVRKGFELRVVEVRGLTLIVEPVEEERSP